MSDPRAPARPGEIRKGTVVTGPMHQGNGGVTEESGGRPTIGDPNKLPDQGELLSEGEERQWGRIKGEGAIEEDEEVVQSRVKARSDREDPTDPLGLHTP